MTNLNTIKIKSINNGAIPSKQTTLASAYDCYANEQTYIEPNQTVLIPLGFALNLPEHIHAKLYIRSSLALKSQLMLANGVGVIDSDYRNEVKAIIYNNSNKPITINKGDRVVQIEFTTREVFNLTEIQELDSYSKSNRTGGFGSTGTN